MGNALCTFKYATTQTHPTKHKDMSAHTFALLPVHKSYFLLISITINNTIR